jgi:hypothetical protein
MYRQGDVALFPIKVKDLSNAQKEQETDVVLAEGESTGHAHRIVKALAALYILNEMRILHLEEEAKLQHEEHGEIILPPGQYEVIIQREYHPREVRNVLD